MVTDLRVHDLPPATLLAFLEACVAHPGQDLSAVAAFAGFSASTGRKALPTLEALTLVERDGNGRYSAQVDGVSRGGDHQAGLLVLRRALQSYRPFEALCEGLALGESSRDAVRKAALLLGLGNGAVDKFDVLIRLGRDLGILQVDGKDVTLAAKLVPAEASDLLVLKPQDVESEAKARLFNARWLGRTANNLLDEVDRRLLCDALLKYQTDPRGSVHSSGQALEDFLREIASSKGYAAEAKKASGAGQLATLLVSKGLIRSHHQKLVEAVSTARNATSHRKDKKTLTPWEITDYCAFAVLAQVLTAIRSIGEYVTTGDRRYEQHEGSEAEKPARPVTDAQGCVR